ncbi:MAG: phosphotransferase [Legionellaceae bacterium]|nr:phosphotransferase [Legionellaceae bacterium]
MWNDVLKKIDANKTPRALVERWAAKPQNIKLVSEGVNLVYRFEASGQGFYARITHAALRSETELQAALAYQRHLFEHEVAVCEPVTSVNQLWVESFRQENEVFLAHVCREVPGKPIHYDYGDALYRHWGSVLGRLHHAAKTFNAADYAYTSWHKSLDELHEYAPQESEDLQSVLREVTRFFNERKQTSENFGLTHGDHREGNVLTDGKQIHIIDFDLPSNNWFMEDVARPFFHPIVYNEKSWASKLAPYIEGYLSVMPESSIDLKAFSKQIQMKALEIYLWTKNNWSGDTAPGRLDTKQWLKLTHEKIVHDNWVKQLTFGLG